MSDLFAAPRHVAVLYLSWEALMLFRSASSIALLFIIGFPGLVAANQPGLYNTYVASSGSDSNDCSFSAPCQTLAGAASKTATGGVISCWSQPAAASIFIVSSVTIDCPSATGFGNVQIDLPPTDTMQSVQLRGLTLFGLNSLSVGVDIQAANTVILENMNLRQLYGRGVYDHRSSPGKLIVKDTMISDCSGPGVVVAGAPGTAAVMDNVTLTGNTYGIAVASGNRASVNRSTITHSSNAGVEADGGSFVIVDGSTISNNNVGLQSGSAIRVSNSNIEFNATAVNGPTGTFGNNRFSGNGSDGTALTPVGGSSTDLAQK